MTLYSRGSLAQRRGGKGQRKGVVRSGERWGGERLEVREERTGGERM